MINIELLASSNAIELILNAILQIVFLNVSQSGVPQIRSVHFQLSVATTGHTYFCVDEHWNLNLGIFLSMSNMKYHEFKQKVLNFYTPLSWRYDVLSTHVFEKGGLGLR